MKQFKISSDLFATHFEGLNIPASQIEHWSIFRDAIVIQLEKAFEAGKKEGVRYAIKRLQEIEE